MATRWTPVRRSFVRLRDEYSFHGSQNGPHEAMSQPEDDATEPARSGRDRRTSDKRTADGSMFRWLAESVLRIGLSIVGLVLLVYALGRAVGVDLLAIVVDTLVSPVGRWIVVAAVGFLLIVVAQRGFRDRV